MRITRQALVRGLCFAFVAGAVPLALSAGGVRANTACAQADEELSTGTCCLEQSSLCNAGGTTYRHYYYKKSGRCS